MGTRGPNAQGASLKHLDRLSDFDLLQRLRKRDAASLRELHRRHASFVNAIALRVLGREEEAAGVVQNVFIHLWNHGFELDEQRARFRSWLFVVARNRAIDRRRHMQGVDGEPIQVSKSIRALVGEHVSEDSLDGDTGDAALSYRAESRRINAAAAALTDPEREILELAFYDGYTHTEIAAELRAPLDDVKRRLRTSMETLHRILRDGSADAGAGVDRASPRAESTPKDGDQGEGPIGSPGGEDAGSEEATRSLEDLAAGFALGALDGEERSAFETRLFSADVTLWRRVRDFASTTDGLISRIGARALSDDAFAELETHMIGQGLLRPAADDDSDARFSWKRRLAILAAVLGAGIFAGTTSWLEAERRMLRSDLAVSEEGRAELGRELADLKETIGESDFEKRQIEIALESSEDALASVMRPTGRDFRLQSSSRDLKVTARAFLDTESKRIWVSIDALPALPPDQTYQLWVFVDDEAIDGVVFPAREGAIQVEAEGPASGAGKLKLGVTIEPAGGSPLPTGPIIISGG